MESPLVYQGQGLPKTPLSGVHLNLPKYLIDITRNHRVSLPFPWLPRNPGSQRAVPAVTLASCEEKSVECFGAAIKRENFVYRSKRN